MNIPLTIDLSEIKLGPYDNSLPMIQAGIGENLVQVSVVNIPKDMTSHVEKLNKSLTDYRTALDKKQAEVYEWQQKYTDKAEELRRVQSASSEDRARPPLPNETLQALLTLMNQGRNYTEEINQIQAIRLLTGWGLREAQGFVRSNRPQAAEPATPTEE